MASIIPAINRQGQDITFRDRQLGARDTETEWPAVTWVESTIKAMFRELPTVTEDTPEGRVETQRARMYTGVSVEMRDQVTYNGYYWEIEDVRFMHVLRTTTGYYDSTLIRLGVAS